MVGTSVGWGVRRVGVPQGFHSIAFWADFGLPWGVAFILSRSGLASACLGVLGGGAGRGSWCIFCVK